MDSITKILIADDEPDILEFLSYTITKQGYQVLKATNGAEAIEIAKKELPALIILDIMMPKKSGIEACEIMRAHSELDSSIIIFLTALVDETIQVKGLEIGADDYISKPISAQVLISKINALLRRTKIPASTHISEVIKIDKEKHQVLVNSENINLAKKEFELLNLLMSKPGRVFLRQEIMDAVWGNQVIVGDRTIDVHVRKIRAKLGIDCIVTIKGVGYKFEIAN